MDERRRRTIPRLGLDSNRGRNGGIYQEAEAPSLMVILARAAIVRLGWSEEERLARARFCEGNRRTPRPLPAGAADQ